jgi:signal transduction histidine kinase
MRINLFRIVQESLNNIVKHAQATEVKFTIARANNRMTLSLEDNGCGFVPGARSAVPGQGGFGLAGMQERAQLLGGEFRVRSAPGVGATIVVDIPLNGTGQER